MAKCALGEYTNFYRVWVDGKPTKIECLGGTKKEAWAWFCDEEWAKYFPGVPLPKRYRVKFERIESVFNG